MSMLILKQISSLLPIRVLLDSIEMISRQHRNRCSSLGGSRIAPRM